MAEGEDRVDTVSPADVEVREVLLRGGLARRRRWCEPQTPRPDLAKTPSMEAEGVGSSGTKLVGRVELPWSRQL